ncbi:transcriptional regulator, LysR family [Methylobacterium sp. 4-46]|uniref:LysR family transcriptional regulator n=1 Tax=unclassified Methylobacterium TaxID=2615210 RepID=UPI000165CAAD|nr:MULTISPECIES: LysR family transcriptional regulator [Methylobacterium]ACA16424.1 transcriptional regulator, LysR family [Methylobacterium sp. 4-46]WFT82134.1 LysR family transcriptional regulator [Methylobacterium nodulans]
MDRLGQLELLVAIAEAGTISGAAQARGLSVAAASRTLAALEERLGVLLVRRNTRTLSLTDEGGKFLARARGILADVADSEAEVTGAALDPSGLLRVSASLSFGLLHIAPLLPAYHARYPNVRVHVEISNRYVDLIDAGIDVAIRTREFEPDRAITIRRLAETRRILTGAPSYLARAGCPAHPRDLARHALLIYVYANNPNELTFTRGEETVRVPAHGLLESNDGQILRAAALNGLGLLVQPTYIVHDDVAAGRLVPVLDAWDLPRLRINFAYPTRKHLSAKVRSFIAFMTAHFEAHDFSRKWTGRAG